MDSARYDVVARALGRRLGQNRRLDLEVTPLVKKAASRLLKPVPQDEILLQLAATQIKIAMLQAQLLGGQLFALSRGHGDPRRVRRHRTRGKHGYTADMPR